MNDSPHHPDQWAISPRSLVIGALSALSIALILPYTINVIHGSRIGLSSCTPAAFILFFVLLLTVQVSFGLLKRSWLLRPGPLRAHQAVLHGCHSGTVRSCGLLASGGWIHGYEVQPYQSILRESGSHGRNGRGFVYRPLRPISGQRGESKGTDNETERL